jgi:hypothetical protein
MHTLANVHTLEHCHSHLHSHAHFTHIHTHTCARTYTKAPALSHTSHTSSCLEIKKKISCCSCRGSCVRSCAFARSCVCAWRVRVYACERACVQMRAYARVRQISWKWSIRPAITCRHFCCDSTGLSFGPNLTTYTTPP